MGFGGANAHVTLEEANREARCFAGRSGALASAQSSELILLSAATRQALLVRIESLIPVVGSHHVRAELTDLSAALAGSGPAEALRIAIVTDSPWHLAAALRRLCSIFTAETISPRYDGRRCPAGAAKRRPGSGRCFRGKARIA